MKVPLWMAVALSRVLVLGVAVLSALLSARVSGWALDDPGRSTLHLGSLGNVLAAAADRWDSIHYIHIAEHGYTTAASSSFYPLYPLLIRVLAFVTGSYVIAGAAISLASFVIALVLLHRLTVEELGVENAHATVLLLAFAPLSFFFTAVYTEALFLAVSVGAFYAARHQRWAIAALLAAAATATRVPGILVICGIAVLWWQSQERPRRAIVWFALSTLPLLAFSLYLNAHGYGLLASIRNESTYGRTMVGPPAAIYQAVLYTLALFHHALYGGPPLPAGLRVPLPLPLYDLSQLVVLGISLVALGGAWRWLPKGYAIYATLALIVALWTVYPVVTLKSFDRYALTLFPLWMVAARWINSRRLLGAVLVLEIAALVFYTHQFATWTFVA